MGLEIEFAAASVADMRVELGRRQVGVAQHLLHAAQIGAALEQMRGERVSEQVRVHALGLEARFLGEALEHQKGTGSRESAALRVQEELGPVAPVEVRATAREVPAESLGCGASERDDALLVSLSGGSNETPVEVHVGLAEPDRLADAQARPVEELGQGAVSKR